MAGVLRAQKRESASAPRCPDRPNLAQQQAIFCSILFGYPISTAEMGLQTMKTFRALGSLVLAASLFGTSQPGMAQFQSERGAASATGMHSPALRGQERAIPVNPLLGRPEYPPPGYLADVDELRDGRAARAERGPAGPFTGGIPGSTERALPSPEFAPGGYDMQSPSGQSTGRDHPAYGDQRWSSRSGTPTHESSWPNPSSLNAPMRPGFAPESLPPGRHDPLPGSRELSPAYPSQSPGWPY
jgi:hypothetical protein